MVGKVLKPNLAGLRGDYGLPKINASSWTDTKALIDACFANILVWEESGEKYLQVLAETLYCFSQSDAETEKVRNYAKQVSRFLLHSSVISKGAFYYKLKATEAEAQRQEVLAKLQGAATGAALSNLGATTLRKMAFDEVFSVFDESNDETKMQKLKRMKKRMKNESSFMIKKNSHYYNMHTPTKKYFVSPQKSIIQNTDRATCSEYFDIRLSTDIFPKCSDILENEYETHMKNMKVNSSLQSALGEGYLEFANKLFTIDMSIFSKEIFNIEYASNNPFIEFLRQSYNDLCVCWNDPRDYYQSGERILLTEVFIQQLAFIYSVVDNVYTHTLEDTLKNLKHGKKGIFFLLPVCTFWDRNNVFVQRWYHLF